MSRLRFKILVAFSLWLTLSSCNNAETSKEDEIAKIKYESFGCFGGTKSTITFVRKNGITFAKVQSKENNKVTRVAKIQSEKLDSVIAAVKRLKKGGGCTSWIKYTIKTKSENFVREDESCQETGFSDLLREIFGKPN